MKAGLLPQQSWKAAIQSCTVMQGAIFCVHRVAGCLNHLKRSKTKGEVAKIQGVREAEERPEGILIPAPTVERTQERLQSQPLEELRCSG